MGLFRKKVKQRRLEVRKNIPNQRGQLWQRFVACGGPVSLVLAIAFTIAAISLVVSARNSRMLIRIDDVMPRRFARVDFQTPNNQRTEQARQLAASQSPSTFILDTTLTEEVKSRLASLPQAVKDITDPKDLPPAITEQFKIENADQLSAIASYASEDLSGHWLSACESISSSIADLVIISPKQYEYERQHLSTELRLSTGQLISVVNKTDRPIITYDQPENIRRQLEKISPNLPSTITGIIHDYLARLISSGRPTYSLDRQKSAQDAEAARQAVAVQYDSYPADSLIFEGGRVGDTELAILRSEQSAWQKHLEKNDPSRKYRQLVGSAATTMMIVFSICAYIVHYRPRVVRKHMRGLAIACLMLLMMSLVRILTGIAMWNQHLTIGTVVLVAMILTIAYDQRFGLACSAGFALLLNVMLDGDMSMLISMLLPTGVAVLLIREIRTRSKLVESGAIAALTALTAVLLTRLASGENATGSLWLDCGWAGGSVLSVGIIVQGVLPIIERIFHIATAMTLLEWCDANKKLLKRLAMEAPGTFNHSLMLGTLCEAAAETIGANGLLARVGAYYHDIGKINKPRYFVENQFGSPSMHDKLSPAMSLLVITGHVKDGIEMAREYNLPPVLHQFITTHHGTTLVKYFYHAAKQKNAEDGKPIPDDTEFRYPGPKPQSAESAILMLADATESSVRAMPEPTPARIEAQANAILNDRLTDGQLDECELTLRDVHRIEQSLIKSLCGIYHGRIAYPKDEPAKNDKDQRKPASTQSASAN